MGAILVSRQPITWEETDNFASPPFGQVGHFYTIVIHP